MRDRGRASASVGNLQVFSAVLFYVFLNSFHFAFCRCCLLKNIFLGNYLASTRWSSLPCNMCPVPRTLSRAGSLLPVARLPKVILHVVVCTLLYMFNNLAQFSLLFSLLALQSAVATFYWSEIPVFFSSPFLGFSFTFPFFHIFCNNLYSWCVPARRWALSLSHGWCSTTVYWLEFPPHLHHASLPPPSLANTPLRSDLDFELVSDCGLQHWNWGQCLSYWVRWIQNDINGNWACPDNRDILDISLRVTLIDLSIFYC